MQLDFGFPRMELPPRVLAMRAPPSRSLTARQFEFYGFDRHHQHTYFFAVLADRHVADAVDARRREIVERMGLVGGPGDASRLHMSLLCLMKQGARPLPIEAEEAALDAARFVRLEPFDISLDRARTFGRSAESSQAKRPIVLTASDISGMRGLYERLHGVLERARIIGGKPRPFTPHMTMLYDTRVIDEPVAPIGWTVREFYLVHSLHGKSQYRIVGSFPLRG